MPIGLLFQKLQELSAILALILRDHLMELSLFESELSSLKMEEIRKMVENADSEEKEMISAAKNQLTGNVKKIDFLKILNKRANKIFFLHFKKCSDENFSFTFKFSVSVVEAFCHHFFARNEK